jgi:hypothetical protein
VPRNGVWRGERFVDGGYPEAGRGEGADHHRQRPVPERQHVALAAGGGGFDGVLVGREIVDAGTDQRVALEGVRRLTSFPAEYASAKLS